MAIFTKLGLSVTDVLIFILCVSASWICSYGVYNRWFHPLSHIPGPLLGRISPWPSIFHAFKGDRHLWLEHCFKKYGNKIRIEPNTVLFRSATASRHIYESKANVQRAPFYDALMRKDADRNTVSSIDNDLHAKKRKMLNLAFTEKSLRAASVFMIHHIDRWIELILDENDGDDWKAVIDFAEWADRLVFDILGDVAYGKSFEIKEPGHNPIKAIPHAMVRTMRFLYPISKSPLLPVIPWLRPRGLSKFYDIIRPEPVRLYDEFVVSSVGERLQREKEAKLSGSQTRPDIFHFLCNATDPDTSKPGFTDVEIYAEARLLLIAGSDSTSVIMSGMFFYLSHYPDVKATLENEILSIFQSPHDIKTGAKLQSCKYLKACIDEAMRISPAGLSELPRQVLPGGISIDGEYFPPGTIVGTAGWTDGHNEEVYGDVDAFRPERRIPSVNNPATEVSRIKAAFYPFSRGPFNCAGTNFALQELMLMVAKTVHICEFRLAPGFEQVKKPNGLPRFDLIDAYITVKNGPMLQFRKRRV